MIVLCRVVLIVGAFALLELLCRSGQISRLTLIPPSEMVTTLWSLFSQGEVLPPLQHTLTNVAIAFACAVVSGFLIGAGIHALPRVRRTLDPVLASYYAVPTFAFYPLFIVIFGLNDIPLIAIGYIFGVVAVIMNTLNGLDRIPPVLFKVANVHHLNAIQKLWLIILPAVTPYLFTGVKLALAYAFIGVLAGEFILSGSGIGYAIAYAYDGFDIRTMYALMLLILVLVVFMNTILHLWEGRIMRRRRGLL
jgi:NitT/TauT family transport system permease protein